VRVFSNSPEVWENLDTFLRTSSRTVDGDASLARLESYLSAVRDRFQDYAALTVLGPDAELLARTGRLSRLRLPDDWLSRVAIGEEVRGDTYWDDAQKRYVLDIVRPVRGPRPHHRRARRRQRRARILDPRFQRLVTQVRQSRDELHTLSITDRLTGLYNRGHMMETLAAETARCRRGNTAYALLMLDIDHFKAYNDTYGHLAGDKVLEKMGVVLREAVRENEALVSCQRCRARRRRNFRA